ncbi:MAG: hypothetical protein OYH77_08660, partial [Pseudomonadota bacterium]|nr:hypothetical protein [Pseudomonadota bacterium]
FFSARRPPAPPPPPPKKKRGKSTRRGNAFSYTKIIYGASEYLRRRAIEAYLKQHQDYAIVKLTTVEDFDFLCHQSDLFAPKTLNLISTNDEMLPLWQYLAKHGTSNALLFNYQRESLSKKLLKLCKEAAAVITHCPEPSAYAYRRLLATMCQEQGLDLDAKGQQTLLRTCGNNLDFLHNETSKLALIFGNQRISHDDIAPHLGILREDTAFLLSDLLLQRKYDQAQIALEKFLRRGDATVQLLGLIAYCLRKQLSSNNHPPYANRTPNHAGQSPTSPAHTLQLLKACQQADANLKTAATPAQLAMFDVIEAMR